MRYSYTQISHYLIALAVIGTVISTAGKRRIPALPCSLGELSNKR